MDKGGGGVRYSDEMWVRRIGGWDVRCVREGEKEVCRRRGRRGDGWRMCRVRVDGSFDLSEIKKSMVRSNERTWSGFYEG